MLAGRAALVTGSTSGIGLGIAKVLAANGAHVMLNGFGDAGEIEALRAGLEKEHGVRVAYSGANLMERSEVDDLVSLTKDQLGSVDILVNNAGIQHVAPVRSFPTDKWDALLALNLSSCFHSIQSALPHMEERGFGRIINVSSVHGKVASTGKSAYVAAKHGLIGLTKVVALEYAGTGITANSICPGWVLTPLVQAQVDARAAEHGLSTAEAEAALLGEKQPSKQFATPEQVGGLAAYLASDAAAQVTGTDIPIDGGWTAQ
jgi:3-hydroxybutyrate dehydrogenase